LLYFFPRVTLGTVEESEQLHEARRAKAIDRPTLQVVQSALRFDDSAETPALEEPLRATRVGPTGGVFW